MNTDFRIGLISDDPYHLGLLKGYCHAHRYRFFESTFDRESIKKMIQIQPNIIIIATDPVDIQTQKNSLDLIRDMSISHQIPVCYLRDINSPSNLPKELICWIDATLDAPLDINQLKAYLHNKFNLHNRFIQEKRSYHRRAAHDRRLSMFERKNDTFYHGRPTNDNCFMLEPFQIDQRSKSVLFNGKLLNLTRKEFELFELLAKDTDRVFMTHEIINHLWPENNRATKSDLYQYMHLLRKKIEDDPNNPQWILTVKGFGYKLNVPAKPSASNIQGIELAGHLNR
ncbi:winged helix family transcriptional regulator [Candidatus Methylobacter oryzae]|nr:winged helix family transcriptional regulator [Candidatus Methylobacter oryzae]